MIMENNKIASLIKQSIDVKKELLNKCDLINKAAELIISKMAKGGKLITMGNGGSAADAQHITAELIGKFEKRRKAIPSISLTTNTSVLTSLANDFEYSYVFVRQLEAILSENDVIIAISTSGNSENVNRAVQYAREKGNLVIALTGDSGGALRDLADLAICVPSNNTARIQESHLLIEHILCSLIEEHFSNKGE